MRILLLLWASGALGGPCRPSNPSTTGSSLPHQSASTDTDSQSASGSMGSLSASGSQGTSTGTLSSWLTSSVSGTIPGQPGNTNTIPGQSDSTDTETGQPSNTNTIPESDGSNTIPGQTGTATSGQSGSIETETGTASIPSLGISETTLPGTETGSTLPGNTDTTLTGTETGPSDTETGTETGLDGTQTGTETGSTGTQTGPNHPGTTGTEGTETGPVDTETGVTGTETNPAGTQTGSPNTGTGSIGSETDSTGVQTGPTHSDNTETGTTTDTGASNTETGPSAPTGTETGSVGTQSDSTGTETGSSGTDTGPTQPGNTETASSGTEGSPTQPTGTETGSSTETSPSDTETSSAGTEGSATQSVITETGATESASSGSESASTQPGNTDTTSGTETGPNQPSNTETGATETEPSGTETGSSATESNPTQPGTTEGASSETGPSTETGPAGTETQPTQSGNTETASPSTETEPTQPGATETATSGSAIVTSDVLPSTTSAGVPTTLPPTTTTSGQSESYASTVTVPPENWSPTCASGHPEWTTNTWITTTSEGSTEQTVVPVIVGSKECDDDGSGLILFGFPPVTGVWFKFPGFPGFSFPCIQTFITKCNDPPKSEKDDGDDDDDDKSSTACSETVTASDCLVACTTYTGPADAEITPDCTTTCTKTHTGCSVTGVTSTTTEAEGCSATGGGEECAECSDELLYTMNGSLGRDVADEDPLVEKRWSSPESNRVNPGNKLGSCVIPASVPIAFPQYPEGNDVFLYEQAIKKSGSSPLRLIDRWYFWERKDDGRGCYLDLNGPKPSNQYFGGKPLPAQGAANYQEKAPSIDHIFEKSFLKDFWWSITPRNGRGQSIRGTKPSQPVQQISCDDLIYYGSAMSSPFGSQPNNAQDMEFVKDVFKTYPGARQNPGGQEHQQIQPLDAHFLDDFIGVDAWTNEAKGFATTPQNIRFQVGQAVSKVINWQTISLVQMEKEVNSQIEIIDKLFIGVQLANQPHSHQAMIRQNLRVYKALLDMDKNARDCLQDPAVVDNKWSFAERYKAFMENRFTGTETHSINQAIAQAFTAMTPRILQDLNDCRTAMLNKINGNTQLSPQQKTTQEGIWKGRYNTLNKRYTTLLNRARGAGTTSINVAWDWDIGNIPTKRDEVEEGPSCKVASTTSESATTLSTVVSRSETESDPTSTGEPLTRCDNDDGCKDWDCDEGKTATCATVALLPGFKICQCEGEDPSSTTSSAPEPTNTGEGKGCLSNTECDMECEEGREPSCFHWPFNPDNAFGTCVCRLIPTTTETPTPTTTSTTTSTSTTPRKTVTVTAEPEPTPTAYCDVYAAGLFWYVEITRIDGWSDDGGSKLKDEEGGCGAMTGWHWYGETEKWGTSVAFNLPFTIKAGCVERAIVSAGGPKLECDTHPTWEITDKKLSKGDAKMAMAAEMLQPDEPSFPDLYQEAVEESEEKYGTVTVTDLYTPVVWGQPTSSATH